MWTTVSGNERGKDMREEIQTFIGYMEEEKHASKNTTLSYRRDLLKMADYLEKKYGNLTSDSELLYLTLHINCLISKNKGKEETW